MNPTATERSEGREQHARFLERFVGRGWLHGTRDDAVEQAAVDYGLRKRWLRRELSEVHFTPAGRRALSEPFIPTQDPWEHTR
jgi:hypothetical protein